MKLIRNVFITIDTEHSIGGAFSTPSLKPVGNEKRVFGLVNGKSYGIPLIIEMGKRYGFGFTFFVEAMSSTYFGREEIRKVCHYLLERDQDVQLHIHPEFLSLESGYGRFNGSPQPLSFFERFDQEEIITKGIETLKRCGQASCIAFRAGGYNADYRTLDVLRKNCFFIDSSYNSYYKVKAEKLIKGCYINDARHLGGIWEFPITNFRDYSLWSLNRNRPFDINGAGFLEMKAALEYAKDYGPQNITIVLHSFSFIKSYDSQYQKIRPRFNIIRRFESLCKYLAANKDAFAVRTFGSLSREEVERITKDPRDYFPRVPARYSFVRYIEQARDRWT